MMAYQAGTPAGPISRARVEPPLDSPRRAGAIRLCPGGRSGLRLQPDPGREHRLAHNCRVAWPEAWPVIELWRWQEEKFVAPFSKAQTVVGRIHRPGRSGAVARFDDGPTSMTAAYEYPLSRLCAATSHRSSHHALARAAEYPAPHLGVT